jgi:hypothetical protein
MEIATTEIKPDTETLLNQRQCQNNMSLTTILFKNCICELARIPAQRLFECHCPSTNGPHAVYNLAARESIRQAECERLGKTA